MKRNALLIFALLISFCVYSQDFKILKFKKLNKGDYQVTRLFIITDSVRNPEIDEFISEFISKLEFEFVKNNLHFECIRKGALYNNEKDSILNSNPNGIMTFYPSGRFIRHRGLSQKPGLSFNIEMSYRISDEMKYIRLFEASIGVITDSFGNSGIPAAKNIFNRMVKAGFLPKEIEKID